MRIVRSWLFGLFGLSVLLLGACSSSDDSQPDAQRQASELAEQLSSPHSPANESILQSLMDNDLGSDPFYLIEYRELRDDDDATQALLDEYETVLQEHLQRVGATLSFDNAVLQQFANPDGLTWHEVRGIYFPSPQALLDVLQDPGFQNALQKEHSATRRLHVFWITPLVVRSPVDLQPERDEFYMANVNQHRERALYADGTDHGLTGSEADALYTDRMLAEVLPGIGAYPVLAGPYSHLLLGTDPDWDTFALVRYPSLPEFFGMVSSPLFKELLVNKDAGLERSSSMRTSPRMEPVLP